MTWPKPVEAVPDHPFDYGSFRYLGSHLLRRCALCGGELEYAGETPDEAHKRENESDPWAMGDGADCEPLHKYDARDRRLDSDDHDRCQCGE